MRMTKHRWIGLIVGITVFMTAFGAALAATFFQVSREVPSKLTLGSAVVISGDNLALWHDAEKTKPVTSLEFATIELQPPLMTGSLQPEVWIYTENKSEVTLAFIDPCRDVEGVGSLRAEFFDILTGSKLGEACGKQVSLNPGQIARTRVFMFLRSDLESGEYEFTTVFGAVGAVDGPTAIQPPDGMVSWWPGDGNANDIVGGNDGALTGGFAQGKVRQGFSLDGSGDLVVVPPSTNLNITGDVTVDLWARRTLVGQRAVMVAKGLDVANAHSSYRLLFQAGDSLEAGFERSDGPLFSLVGPRVTDSNFHHYAYVRNDDTHKLFMDGIVIASGDFIGSPGDTSGLPLVLGAIQDNTSATGFSGRFGGVIDEVEIFNRALSNEETKAIYDAGSAGKIKPLPTPIPVPTRIVFSSHRTGKDEIHFMNSDGTGQTQVTSMNDPSRGARYPSWSPDRSRITFSAEGDIYIVNANGTGLVQLTDTPNDQDITPSWSPDGTRIAFATLPGVQSAVFDLYVMNADGSNSTRLTTVTCLGCHDQNPAWSPDGTRIAFQSRREGNWEIYVMNPDGTGQTRLTINPNSDEREPTWSPDGTMIAFSSTQDGGSPEIYAMNANGAEQRRLTNDPDNRADTFPTWSPDGSKIAFASEGGRINAPFDIYVMNADGTSPTNISNSPADDMQPSWGYPVR